MNEHDETENLQAPPKLVEALRNVQKERLFVPSQVDDAILQAAREHLPQVQRKIIPFPRWLALAASFALAAGLFGYFQVLKTPKHFAAEDVNRDGSVDILDAFALAQSIEEGNTGQNDINHDATVDRKDAEAIAAEAVRLNQSEPLKTSLFDTNCTNFHELEKQISFEKPYCLAEAPGVLSHSFSRFQFVSIREIRVSPSEPFCIHKGDRS